MAQHRQKTATFSACIAISVALSAAAPGQAITFDISQTPTQNSPTSLSFSAGGVNLTFLQPVGTNNPYLQSNVNGVCSRMTFNNQLQTAQVFCGQNTTDGILPDNPNQAANQTLDSLAFAFDRDMILKSFTIAAVSFQEPDNFANNRAGQAGKGRVTFTPAFNNAVSGLFSETISIDTTPVSRPEPPFNDPDGNASFLNSNPSANCLATVVAGGSRCTLSFGPDYRVNNGTRVTVSTLAFSALSDLYGPLADPGAHWRLAALDADEHPSDPVPVPLPILGAGAALSWSRRMRSRLARASRLPS